MRYSPLSRLPILWAVLVVSANACADGPRLAAKRQARAGVDAPIVPAPPPPQSITLEDLLALHDALLSDDFSQLDARMAWNVDSARADPGYEIRYGAASNVFSVADPRLRPHLDAWVAAEPQSAIARLARAAHSVAMGDAARGTKFASETSEEQFGTMRAWYRIALDDLARARAIDPTNVMLSWLRLHLATHVMGPEARRAILDEGLRSVPGSLMLRGKYAFALRPRWGGSIEEMEAFADESDAASQVNPRFRVLRGIIPYDSAEALSSAKDYDGAIAMYSNALMYGEWWWYRTERGDAYRRARRYEEAIADFDTALAQMPALTEARVSRGVVRARLAAQRGGAEGEELLRLARLDVCIAAELDPTRPALLWDVEHRPELRPTSLGGTGPLSPLGPVAATPLGGRC
jgi:tetratricopeptide (TPR) repeat protein